VDGLCDILFWILLEFCRENSNWLNIGLNYEALYVRSCIVKKEDPLGTKIANILAQYCTITSKQPLSHRMRIERVSPVRSRPYNFCVPVTQPSVKPQSCRPCNGTRCEQSPVRALPYTTVRFIWAALLSQRLKLPVRGKPYKKLASCWSIVMSLFCDKSVTTKNLALLSYWYRKKVCKCTFNRYSVIMQFAKVAAGEQFCRRCTHRKL